MHKFLRVFLFACAAICGLLLSGTVIGFAAARPDIRGQGEQLSLMPFPASVQEMPGRLPFDSRFCVSVRQYSDTRLKHGLERALARLEARIATELPRECPPGVEPALVVLAEGPGMKVQSEKEDETYRLETSERQAVLRAKTVVGILHGLETLLQLLRADERGYFWPLVRIEDHPRFPWRGLLLDVARDWMPVEAIERTLDLMSVVKLNVFHWHLTDDQGFRVESRLFPRLHKMGSNGQYYTQAQIREVIAYARNRGIRVLPEFDVPGHAHSWFVGYPQFASAPGPYAPQFTMGGDSVPFDPTREATYRFLDAFFGEMAALFPDPYLHIGGDEVWGEPWDNNSSIQAFMKRHGFKDNAALQAYFNRRLERIVRKHGKRMVGWDEIRHPDLPKDVVVQSWRGSDSLVEGARQGFAGILSAPYYLDKMFKTTAYYAGDPLPAGNSLDAKQAALILGGEACAWGEVLSPEIVDSRIWPYAGAVAERLWSRREVTDAADMYRRMDVLSIHLEEAGSQHLTNPAAMLRRAAGGEAPGAVRDFMGLMEPLRQGLRMDERRPTQMTPLTALGDIVVADPAGARRFADMVDTLLRDAPRYAALREELTQKLRSWREMKTALADLAQRAPVFHDAEGSAADLADLGAAGEEALSYLSRGVPPPADWTERQKLLLERAAKPKGLLKISILDALRQLIEAAGNIKQVS